MSRSKLSRFVVSGASARFMVLLVLVLGGSLAALGQQITGTIVGTVKDQQGAVVNIATVKATNIDTGFTRSAPTNEYGGFRIDYLPVGNYTVEVTAANFKTFVQKNVALSVDQTQTLGITLEIGAQAETVTVTEAPPTVNTSDAGLGRTISPEEIIGLPLVNRNAYSELSITPGVMANSMSQQNNPNGTNNFVNGFPSTQVQVNGSVDGQSAQVSFYLDGGLNNQTFRNYGLKIPNPDALQEFRVETSNYAAQYGHFSSAVVTVLTKSGTNQFHGSLFEFNRNTAFNAYPWNAPTNSAGKFINAPYHRNQFGGVLGGPVMKNKAFFFFGYGGLRQVVGQYVSGARVPTAAERLGDFTGDLPSPSNPQVSNYGSTPFTINMPGTKTVMTGYTNSGPGCTSVGVSSTNPKNQNCVPASLADPTAVTILQGKNPGATLPLPNVTPAGANVPLLWSGYYTGPVNENEYLGKYDQVLGDKDHIAVTYFFVHAAETNQGGGNIGGWTAVQSFTGQTNVNINEVHSFSANTANQVWLSFTRSSSGRTSLPAISIGQLGSTFTVQGVPTLPNINVSGYFNAMVKAAGPVSVFNYYSIRDMITMTKGKHTLIYGGEFALDKVNLVSNLVNYGKFAFAKSAPTTTGNALSDLYTGMVSTLQQDAPSGTANSGWHTSLFLQDNYRVTSRLTANLGVRWDVDTTPVDSRNHKLTFIPSKAALTANPAVVGSTSSVTPSAPAGMFFVGDAGVPRGIVSTKYHHISPRIGFAWDPWGDGKTAIRAGAGVFYGMLGDQGWGASGQAQPFTIRQAGLTINSLTNVYAPTLINGKPSSFPNGNPFPYIYTPQHPTWMSGANIIALDQKVQWPFGYQLNLAVQRQLPLQIALTAAYVGNLSRDVPTMVDANYAPYAPGANSSASGSVGSVNSRRPYDQNSIGTGSLGEVDLLVSNQTASYHALQISASRRMSRNVTVNGFYVWSHALQSSDENAGGLTNNAQDFANLWEEKGPMNSDMRSVATIHGMWKLDYYHGKNFFLKQVANGWTISSIYSLQSGQPLNVVTGSNNNFDSENVNRPNLVAGVKATLDPHRPRAQAAAKWFNTAAFIANGPGVAGGIGPGGADGNTPRNYIIGPGYRDADIGLFRNFNFGEGITFQLRGEATNAFNLVSLGSPGLSGPPNTVGSAPSSSTFGVITGASSPRIIQVGARLTF